MIDLITGYSFLSLFLYLYLHVLFVNQQIEYLVLKYENSRRIALKFHYLSLYDLSRIDLLIVLLAILSLMPS